MKPSQLEGWIMKEHGVPDSKITILERDFEYKKIHNIVSHNTYYKCLCECGKIFTANGSAIKNGKVKSCGCLTKTRLSNNILGWKMKEHGVNGSLLTVIEEVPNYAKEHNIKTQCLYYKCLCECGNEKIVSSTSLLSGKVLSCGCLKSKNTSIAKSKKLEGQYFGLLEVIKDSGIRRQGEILWECKCDCGNTTIVRTSSLRKGSTNSCGCLVSKGEEKIRKILLENNISFIPQKTFSDCRNPKTKTLLRFDFYINDNFILEFDGIQYFKANGGWNTKERLKETKEKDNYKNDYCFSHHIPIKRIPYWALDSLSIDDLLSDKFLVKEGENNGNGLIYNS